ncbi:MAG: hypothetical protein ACJ79S_10565 [Gemmatimonadaceae bacterium]
MNAAVEAALGGGMRAGARSGVPGGERTTARLGRYAWWQLKDFARERGVWIMALGLLALWIFRANYEAPTWIRSPRGFSGSYLPTEADFFRAQLMRLVGVGSFVATLIATHGIVARDRERGYQRFLFAKPVSITRYYLQAFLVHGVGYLAIVAALLLATAASFGRAVPAAGVLIYAGAQYVLVGGLVMLLSTLGRYDFAVGGLLSVASIPVALMGARWHASTWWKVAALLLPPLPSLVSAGDSVARGRLPVVELVAPLCYGTLYVAAALGVLRRRAIRV